MTEFSFVHYPFKILLLKENATFLFWQPHIFHRFLFHSRTEPYVTPCPVMTHSVSHVFWSMT